MRILHILPTLNKNSGVANVVLNWQRHLDREKYAFDYLLFKHDDKSYEEEVKSYSSKIYFIEKPSISSYFSYAKKFKNFLKEHGGEYDAIHCHVLVMGRLYAKCAKRAGIKFFFHSHNSKFSESKIKSVRNALTFAGASKRADYLFACSTLAGQAMFGKKVVKKDNFSVILNGIDLKKYAFDGEKRAAVRAKIGADDNCTVIGTVGRLAKQKNYQFLLDVFKIYHTKNSASKLLIVGEGEERQNLEEKTTALELKDCVIFAGLQDDVTAYLSAMDCFAFPSLFEGLGLAVVEAQANGLFCMVSQYVPEEALVSNCKAISIKSPVEWADNIKATDLQSRERAYENTQSYDIKNTTAELCKIYDKINSVN